MNHYPKFTENGLVVIIFHPNRPDASGGGGLSNGVKMNFTEPKKYAGPERRRFPRISRTFLVVCKDMTGTVATIPHFVYAYGKNISKGGIFFESVEKFPLHTRLEFSLYASTLPEAIKVQGEVVWAKPAQEKGLYYYGISFCEINPHDMLLVEQLVGVELDMSQMDTFRI